MVHAELPDVDALAKSIGAAPASKKPDGASPFYTTLLALRLCRHGSLSQQDVLLLWAHTHIHQDEGSSTRLL